jgi:UDP-N-acetylmuramoyl-tripeptide--D-alanyl-D-alanine ligase
VDDTLKGLQDAARAYLEKFPRLLKIGVTGSSGKTTTKEIAAAIIGVEKNVVMNPGNYNSETGLPLAVFEVRPCHEVGVFEMGMNKQGEMAALASVLKPNVGIVTNIGSAHIGLIGSKGGIAKEKKEIFSHFNEDCIALIPEDSDYRDFLAGGVRGRVSFYGEKSFAGFGGAKGLGPDGYEIRWNGETVRFALPGRHNLANALAAVALAREIPVTDAAIKQGLESAKPLFGRGEIIRGRVTVIRDCYNANPESLAAALELCENMDWPGRRVYVIGEMLELGEESKQAHSHIGRLLASSKAAMVFLYGKETAATASALNDGIAGKIPAGKIPEAGAVRFFHTCDMGALSRALDGYVREGDLVLLKGSRGCALETLTEMLAGAGQAEDAA